MRLEMDEDLKLVAGFMQSKRCGDDIWRLVTRV